MSIIVPCHRVIGANGSLTGYGGGLPAKQWLLAHEAQQAGLFAVLIRLGRVGSQWKPVLGGFQTRRAAAASTASAARSTRKASSLRSAAANSRST